MATPSEAVKLVVHFGRGMSRPRDALEAQVPGAQPGHAGLFVSLLEVAAVENYPEQGWPGPRVGVGVSKPYLLPKWSCLGIPQGLALQINFCWGTEGSHFSSTPRPGPTTPCRSQAPRRPWESGDLPENSNILPGERKPEDHFLLVRRPVQVFTCLLCDLQPLTSPF